MAETSADELVELILDQAFEELEWPAFLEELRSEQRKAGI